MTEQLFRRYAELKRQIASLEEELKTLQPRIIVELKPLRDARLRTSFGIFTVLRKANWTYSEMVGRLEEGLKARQKEEKTNGTAKVAFTEYVQFKTNPVAVTAVAARASQPALTERRNYSAGRPCSPCVQPSNSPSAVLP